MTIVENITDTDTQQELSENNSKRILALITINDQLESVLVHIKTNGFTIIDSKHIQFSKEQAALFCQPCLEDSNLCALILEKENAIQEWKQWTDPMDQKEAPHLIPALFKQHVVYASDSNVSAERDIESVFHQVSSNGNDKQQKSSNIAETKETKGQSELSEDTDKLIKDHEQVINTTESNHNKGQVHDTTNEQQNDVEKEKGKQDAFIKKNVQVHPSSSRPRIPVRIKRNQVNVPKQPTVTAQPLVNKTTKSSRIARLSMPVKEPTKPMEKVAVTRVLPRVAALSNQKLSYPSPTKDGQAKKKTMPTKAFISRLTAPTVASANKNTKKMPTDVQTRH
ncbi:uncharacterized protein B0P05DRAFT_570423 [Gilbertella persicaria]|uniref:uncharacterized protein n=1 Tax=Gilbertella persicaria TaxID=101096 RepID=UPI00221E7205|nr:uncharacterized protein B0P05DRAFT_570423 [Gilbertella persicaria]KAI8084009.1 hypothetical protein B0P05DRAFT_570423 [Gilbertella persicaria]